MMQSPQVSAEQRTGRAPERRVGRRLRSVPRASIVIPTHNEGKHLGQTLEAVRDTTAVDHETIVVDDGSTDGSCDPFRRSTPLERVIVVSQNRHGVAAAKNQGARLARAPALVFLDAHCFPEAGWLEALLRAIRRRGTGIVGPCIRSTTDPPARGYGRTILDADLSTGWLHKRGDAPYPVPALGGACMAVKRDVFKAIGGFDSMRSFGSEDLEICIRSWLLGYEVLVAPEAEVAHVFKYYTNFEVGWPDYVYNKLRTAILHFDGARRARILARLRTHPAFAAAAAELVGSDFMERYMFCRAARRRDGEWYCRTFDVTL